MSVRDYLRGLLGNKDHYHARCWSNREARKFAPLFRGSIVNVSAWQDEDKEGCHYKDYFSAADEYWMTNYKADARGWQGNRDKEIFLDLEKELPAELHAKFDAV